VKLVLMLVAKAHNVLLNYAAAALDLKLGGAKVSGHHPGSGD
jgi:hypothetical protein